VDSLGFDGQLSRTLAVCMLSGRAGDALKYRTCVGGALLLCCLAGPVELYCPYQAVVVS
jgi:hypothetical protein